MDEKIPTVDIQSLKANIKIDPILPHNPHRLDFLSEGATQKDIQEHMTNCPECTSTNGRIYCISMLYILCHYWQEVLRLKDWNIRIEIVSRNRFLEENLSDRMISASIQHDEDYRIAKIWFIKPTEYPTGTIENRTQDMEQDLVHELLHLLIRECDREEFTINMVTEAMIGLRRNSYGNPVF